MFGPSALEQARREDRLIFITSGYFACHWCHVFQRKSLRDPQVAAALNRFIPTLVDRELQPQVDAQLIEFVQRTGGITGWPLNVVLTPQGDPLIGFTYLPRDRFLKVVEATQQSWQREPERLRKLASEVMQALRSAASAEAARVPALTAAELKAAFLSEAMAQADELAGGFGTQGKFPHVPQLQALLSLYPQDPHERWYSFLRLTLDQMAGSGLRDHVDAGFFRYTVDPTWELPHFEKMLYDNALLASLYLQAAEELNRPEYERVGRETLDFMLRALGTPMGGLTASLSAVSDTGAEGGYYLWDRETLKGLLSAPELNAIERLWQMDRASAFEAGYLPVAKPPHGEASVPLASAYEKLRTARAKRSLPRDEKCIAGWNGLALEALSRGAQLQDGAVYHRAAVRLRGFLETQLWDGQRLWRATAPRGRLEQPGTLEDYAHVAAGLWAWQQVSGQPDRWLPKLIAEAWRRFHVNGGWRLSEDAWLALALTPAALEDGVLPSPPLRLVEVSLQWAHHARDNALRARALHVLEQGRHRGGPQPFRLASLVMLLARPLE
jgi:uncharacterized protein YyaL (SSP411 family)